MSEYVAPVAIGVGLQLQSSIVSRSVRAAFERCDATQQSLCGDCHRQTVDKNGEN
jgi:hypothetical protein